ncbi:hypothetical protein H6P81_017264 [Aristolochia fimbriata]|uniref:Protein kinase domain-containing protein n=1 Tax=Aristolochia fimbriata TaxID=158543 RepID=A0AAV7DXP0_ARIFI|nr:hypothetical protein H6P81_017264 [Aristolochia fimbriata]
MRPLSASEIYQGCRTSSSNSIFSESPRSQDLGQYSRTARALYEGFLTSDPSEFSHDNNSTTTSSHTEDDHDDQHSGLIDPRENISQLWLAASDSSSQRDAIISAAETHQSPRYSASSDTERIFTDHFRKPLAGAETLKRVFLGKLGDGTDVAMKVLSPQLWEYSSNHFNQFKSKVEKFAGLEHGNLLRIVEYCLSTNVLIMEHMTGGNLTRFIDNSAVTGDHTLTWVQRIQIALDIAQGLEYLHHFCHPPMIHGNVKMTNILLDQNLNAKLAEPGYSNFTDLDKHRDVYDFGTVLWSLITGLTPSVLKTLYLTDDDMLKRSWGRHSGIIPDTLRAIAHEFSKFPRRPQGCQPRLQLGYPGDTLRGSLDSVSLVIKIAGDCTFSNRIDMPAMSLVVNDLRLCLNLAHLAPPHSSLPSPLVPLPLPLPHHPHPLRCPPPPPSPSPSAYIYGFLYTML